MTIPANLNVRALNTALCELEACADNAPAGTYQDAKDAAHLISELGAHILAECRAAGFRADNCDGLRTIEAAIYGMLRDANPLRFSAAEGFGQSMETDARERVIAQAARNRDFLSSLH